MAQLAREPEAVEWKRDGEGERRKAFEEWLAKKEEDWQGEVLSLDKVGLTTLD
ncbi:hypothetical protein C8Q76DRAFT_797202 [Earliella scabrosa]|nr:hypothetical protein C8Q76DRAFT_797202 [Earliella scabrosa]